MQSTACWDASQRMQCSSACVCEETAHIITLFTATDYYRRFVDERDPGAHYAFGDEGSLIRLLRPLPPSSAEKLRARLASVKTLKLKVCICYCSKYYVA